MRFLSLAVAAGLTLALGACGPEPQPPMPTPSPTTTPFFASDEEALAAAEEVYREYDRISAALLGDPNLDLSVLEDVTAGGLLASERDSIEEARINQLRFEGRSEIVWVELQSVDEAGQVVLHVCEDVTAVAIYDGNGTSMVDENRPPRSTLEAVVVPVNGHLRLVSRELWSESC